MIDWSYDAWAPAPEWTHGIRKLQPDDHVDFHVDLGSGTAKKGRIGVDRFPAPGVNVVMDLDHGRVAAVAPAPGCDAARYLGHRIGWRYYWPRRMADIAYYLHEKPYLDYPMMPQFKSDGWGHSEAYTIHQGLPFPSGSIRSIITHHCFEHLRDGFVPLMDDVYRVLVPDGLLRVIVPLFPSHDAVADPDHKRYFVDSSFDSFCGHLGDANNPTGSWLDSFSVPYTNARFEKGDVYATPAEPGDVWTQSRELRISLRAVK